MKVKTRRRKLPITVSITNGKPSSSGVASSSAKPLASARLIRRFHVLLKRKAQLESGKTRTRTRLQFASTETDDSVELKQIENEIEGLGGLEAYQRMSTIGQGKDRGGGSERVFMEWLKELSVRDEVGKGKEKEKMRLLEVGALKPDNYASCSSWIDVQPIDLRANHPGILEQDFLQMDLETNKEAWNAISLSLVVNFVPEPRDRGRMLRLAYDMLREDGLLFLALPLPCVSNSRYLTFEHLTQLMTRIGFTLERERWKAGGKMAYWLFRKSKYKSEKERTKKEIRFDKKVVLREGKRNNFCILL